MRKWAKHHNVANKPTKNLVSSMYADNQVVATPLIQFYRRLNDFEIYDITQVSTHR